MSTIKLPADQKLAAATPARLWLRVFFFGFAIITVLLLVTLFTPIPYGDLTRLGRLSEHEFGWRVAPPVMIEKDLAGAPLSQADILVVGDSFSATHLWQSDLVRAGYRVSTTFWGQHGDAMCGDFDQWIAKAGFRGKLIIIESVERLFDDRMKKSAQCASGTMTTQLVASEQPILVPLKSLPTFELNWKGTLTSGVITALHTRRAREISGDETFSGQTLVRHVPDGCALFSHRLCDRALFFFEDDKNAELTAETVEQMQRFSAARKTAAIAWMIIPDKTTVYVRPDHSRAFVDALSRSRLSGPDLFPLMREQRTHVRDLYFPNDTHLSMHGQVLLGRRMLQTVQEILPEPPAKGP